MIAALPKKISENDSPTMAWMPQRCERLRCVLARRAAAEVAVDDQDRRALVVRIVERVRAVTRADAEARRDRPRTRAAPALRT